ncbi:MAG: DUF2062 domain-containing protein [Candidatus Omnitrophica bacterium]|nr:DUF2062 domain-containing protein [Candidatus Omnitrophota bacterium]
MYQFVNIPARVLSILQLYITPGQVARGVCLGLFLGFIPFNGPMAGLLFIFFLIFKVNRFSTVIVLPLFKLVYILGVWRIAESLGGYLLIDVRFFSGFWSVVTGLPILALLDLNNTLVAGGLALSFIFCLPVYFISKVIYIKGIEPRFKDLQNSKLARGLTRFKFVNKVVARMDYIRSKTE